MNRIEAEWLCAWALIASKILPPHYVYTECPINVGFNKLMKKCPKCGRFYYADCIDCTFRKNGGVIPDREHSEHDAVHGILDRRYWTIHHRLTEMRLTQFDQ